MFNISFFFYKELDHHNSSCTNKILTLLQDGVTTYSLPCDVRLWPLVLHAAKLYKKLNSEELEKIVNIARENELQPLFPEFLHDKKKEIKNGYFSFFLNCQIK